MCALNMCEEKTELEPHLDLLRNKNTFASLLTKIG